MATVPNWLAAVGVLTPVATALGGYWLAGLNDEKRDERAAKREDLARKAAREQSLADERQAFQREVLLELQDRLLDLMRTTYEVLEHFRRLLRTEGRIGYLSDDLNQRSHGASAAFLFIMERVLDDDLRRELNELHKLATSQTGAVVMSSAHKADPAALIRQIDVGISDLVEKDTRASEHLGRELRKILGRAA